jgi:hypothetical protein
LRHWRERRWTQKTASGRLGVVLAILAVIHFAVGIAVVEAIAFGIGGKAAIAITDSLVLERRTTYQGAFMLGTVLLAAALGALVLPASVTRLALVPLVAVAWGGWGVHSLHLAAARQAADPDRMADHRAADYWTAPDTLYRDAESIAALIGIQNADALEERRRALIGYIWKRPSLPLDRLPDRVERNVDDPTSGRLPALARTTALAIALPHGFQSVVHYFEPIAQRGPPVIYHHGHVGNHLADDALAVINALLQAGRPVVAFTMPGHRLPNTAPQWLETIRAGRIPNRFDHDGYRYLESESFSPLMLFIKPLVVGVNWLTHEHEGTVPFIDAVGFSGGAWTVTVHAAVDPRVRLSIPVAGTLPLYLLAAPGNSKLGDYEQVHPGMLAQANFLEMYVLGAAGPNRRQVQILNQFDGCCFRGVGALDYEPVVAERVEALGIGGSFDLLLTRHHAHEVAPVALKRILDELTSLEVP